MGETPQPPCAACAFSGIEPQDMDLFCAHPDAGAFGVTLRKEPADHCPGKVKFQQHPGRNADGTLKGRESVVVPLTFEALRAVNVRRCVNDFKHTLESWSPLEWAGAMCGEAGEAANIAKKMIRHRDGVAGNKGEDTDLALLRKKLGREYADVVIYACLATAAEGIDLGEAVRETWNAKSEEIGSRERL